MGLCQLKITMIFAFVDNVFYLYFPFSKKTKCSILSAKPGSCNKPI